MLIPKKVFEKVEVKKIYLHMKLRDEGTYELMDEKNETVAQHEGYVPSFFPYGLDGKEQGYGDYIGLLIDIETGLILNWKKPDPETVAKQFNMLENDE